MADTPTLWYEFRNAVYAGNFEAAERLLIANSELIHLTNGLGETALHFLAVEDAREGVAWLRAKGANINTKNTFGTPALFEIAQLGYKELFTWFVENGADLQVRDANNQSIVDFLREFDKEEMARWVIAYDAKVNS